MKHQSLLSRLSPHVELPSDNFFLAIIGKLVESNSQLIGLLDAERLTNAEFAMESARLRSELGNEKAAYLGDHQARSCELPSVVQFMQKVNEKISRKRKVSNMGINKQ